VWNRLALRPTISAEARSTADGATNATRQRTNGARDRLWGQLPLAASVPGHDCGSDRAAHQAVDAARTAAWRVEPTPTQTTGTRRTPIASGRSTRAPLIDLAPRRPQVSAPAGRTARRGAAPLCHSGRAVQRSGEDRRTERLKARMADPVVWLGERHDVGPEIELGVIDPARLRRAQRRRVKPPATPKEGSRQALHRDNRPRLRKVLPQLPETGLGPFTAEDIGEVEWQMWVDRLSREGLPCSEARARQIASFAIHVPPSRGYRSGTSRNL
jgi:hypothetical protein